MMANCGASDNFCPSIECFGTLWPWHASRPDFPSQPRCQLRCSRVELGSRRSAGKPCFFHHSIGLRSVHRSGPSPLPRKDLQRPTQHRGVVLDFSGCDEHARQVDLRTTVRACSNARGLLDVRTDRTVAMLLPNFRSGLRSPGSRTLDSVGSTGPPGFTSGRNIPRCRLVVRSIEPFGHNASAPTCKRGPSLTGAPTTRIISVSTAASRSGPRRESDSAKARPAARSNS